MEDWQKRVVDEKAALDEKLEKLMAFLTNPPEMKPDALSLLQRQCIIMQLYSETLSYRIEAF